MKHQVIQYVGLDIHQATVVVSVRDEQGAVVMRATVSTDKAMVALVRGLGSRVHVVFEEGTQAQWRHDVLRRTRSGWWSVTFAAAGEAGNKSDPLDADRLSELLRLGALKPVYHGASALLTLKELVRST